jgi:hypothetical protein
MFKFVKNENNYKKNNITYKALSYCLNVLWMRIGPKTCIFLGLILGLINGLTFVAKKRNLKKIKCNTYKACGIA